MLANTLRTDVRLADAIKVCLSYGPQGKFNICLRQHWPTFQPTEYFQDVKITLKKKVFGVLGWRSCGKIASSAKQVRSKNKFFIFLSREGIEPPSASYRPILLQRTTITIRSSALFLLQDLAAPALFLYNLLLRRKRATVFIKPVPHTQEVLYFFYI